MLKRFAFLLVATVALGQARQPADSLDGPPFVSAKGWVAVDAKTGKHLGGDKADEARPMASTTKIMTAWTVLKLADAQPTVLDETVTFSAAAARTIGTSSKLQAGDKIAVKELLYGLLLPSGNDAAYALAEHFGPRMAGSEPGVEKFVAAMNKHAAELGMKETKYNDPHGLSSGNVASPRDLAKLALTAMGDERFRGYVNTRQRETKVGGLDVTWTNTNQLLGIEGYDGVKTGTTTAAGACLVAHGRRGEERIIVVVLGSTTADGRYLDTRNLFRWAWGRVGK